MRVLCLALLALLLPGVAAAIEPGEVVFTEVMADPVSAPEWVELYNTSAVALELSGCLLRDAAGAEGELADFTIPSRDYAIASKLGDYDCIVFDSGGSCVRTSDVLYSSIQLNNSDETLDLVCDDVVIDSIVFDWSDLVDDCTGTPTCSANLPADAQDATLNDAWPGEWCVPPSANFVYDALGREMAATPFAVGECPVSGPSCGPGDAIFTEFMIDPPSATREWFEIKVLTGSGCDLHACEIWEGPFDEITEDNLTSEDWGKHEIDAAGNTLALASGAYALFSKGADTVAGLEGDADAVLSDYRYSNVSFANDNLSSDGSCRQPLPNWAYLRCDGETVDRAPYRWTAFEAACAADGVTSEACSVNLHESAEAAEANDDLDRWCVAPNDVVFTDSTEDENPFFGTPGTTGVCLQLNWPAPAEVLISELMISAAQSDEDPTTEGTIPDFPEWFEVANMTSDRLDLLGCTLESNRYTDDGELDPDFCVESNSYVIGEEGAQASIPSAGATVFVKSRCIDGSDASAFGTCDFGEATHFTYGGLSFTDGEREDLRLLCPTGSAGPPVLIDSAGYDVTLMANRKGHSMEFDITSSDAAEFNDDPEEWCEASFDDCIPGTVTNQGECNFGTPGSAGPCKTGLVQLAPSGPGCRCDGGAGGAASGFALLLLGLVGWSRRRM